MDVTKISYFIVDKYIIIDYTDTLYKGGRYVLAKEGETLKGTFLERTQNGWASEISQVTFNVFEGEEEGGAVTTYEGTATFKVPYGFGGTKTVTITKVVIDTSDGITIKISGTFGDEPFEDMELTGLLADNATYYGGDGTATRYLAYGLSDPFTYTIGIAILDDGRIAVCDDDNGGIALAYFEQA